MKQTNECLACSFTRDRDRDREKRDRDDDRGDRDRDRRDRDRDKTRWESAGVTSAPMSIPTSTVAINPLSLTPYSQRYFTILAKRKTLPVWEYKDKFMQMLEEQKIIVLVGETGSGKTTQVRYSVVVQKSMSFLCKYFCVLSK